MSRARSKAKAEPKDSGLEEQLSLATEARFLQFLEANGGGGVDPLSDDGLRFQAEYIEKVGDHPLDVLKTLSKNPFIKPSDRIAAARTLLEYGARKVPAQLELSGREGGSIRLTTQALSRLSEKELAQLEALLAKASA